MFLPDIWRLLLEHTGAQWWKVLLLKGGLTILFIDFLYKALNYGDVRALSSALIGLWLASFLRLLYVEVVEADTGRDPALECYQRRQLGRLPDCVDELQQKKTDVACTGLAVLGLSHMHMAAQNRQLRADLKATGSTPPSRSVVWAQGTKEL